MRILLLLVLIASTGCAEYQYREVDFSGMQYMLQSWQQQDAYDQRQPSQVMTCKTVYDRQDWYGNPIYKTVCE